MSCRRDDDPPPWRGSYESQQDGLWQGAGESDEDPDESDMDSPEEPESVLPCPECGFDVHEDAPRCPVCGHYISREHTPIGDRPRWWIAGLVICLFIAALWGVFG